MSEKQPTVNINVRFPPEVVEALKRYALQDTRSLNGEIIWALRAFIDQREKANKDENRDNQNHPSSD